MSDDQPLWDNDEEPSVSAPTLTELFQLGPPPPKDQERRVLVRVDSEQPTPAADAPPPSAHHLSVNVETKTEGLTLRGSDYNTLYPTMAAIHPTGAGLLVSFVEETDPKLTLLPSATSASHDSGFGPSALQTDAAPTVPTPAAADGGAQLGTWDGVFLTVLLNTYGVMLFLRMGWIVAQCGIPLALLIILISFGLCAITTLSMGAITTNGRVRNGGVYYIISRAVGPKLGGAIGFLYTLGLAVATGFFVVGFAATLVEQIFGVWSLTGSPLNDTRIIGLLLVVFVLIMALIGVDWVAKLNFWLLVTILAAVFSFVAGTFVTKSESDAIVGFSSEVGSANMSPDFRETEGVQYDFAKVLVVFFAEVTGFMAGANMSGDLRNPSEAIPKGTLWALLFCMFTYMIIVVLAGCSIQRDPVGNSWDTHGPYSDSLLFAKVSVWGPLVLGGIYAATLSSALSLLVITPRVLQRLAVDQLVPFLAPFSVTRARDDSPVRGYFLVSFLAACVVLVGDVNSIAPLVTLFFCLTFALVNLSCFWLDISNSPGWRPTFRYHSWWQALSGSLICVAVMFMTDAIWSAIALCAGAALYKYIEWVDTPVNWGIAGEAHAEARGIRLLLSLRNVHDHIKNFRPHFLLMCGDPATRLPLVRFANTLRNSGGGIVFGNVVVGSITEGKPKAPAYFADKKLRIKGFLDTVVARDFLSGVEALCQISGIGRFRPNTVLWGFKENWLKSSAEDVKTYVNSLRCAVYLDMGLVILRGMDRVRFDSPPDHTGNIDVWVLVDDGGLTILLAYILSLHDFWKSHTETDKLAGRLFVVVARAADVGPSRAMTKRLLEEYRLNWNCEVLDGSSSSVYGETMQQLEQKAGLPMKDEKIARRWMRVGDLMRQHSMAAKLVIATLPFPAGWPSERAYLAVLDQLTTTLPPTVLVRGNRRSVLTAESE